MKVDWNKIQGIRIQRLVDDRVADVLESLADALTARMNRDGEPGRDPVYEGLAADLRSLGHDLKGRPEPGDSRP